MIITDSRPMNITRIRGKKVHTIGSLLETAGIIETVSTTGSPAEKVTLTETVATISHLPLVVTDEEDPKMMSETASITAKEVTRGRETASGTEQIMGITRAEVPLLPRTRDRSLHLLSPSPHPLSAPLPPPTPRPLAPPWRRGKCLTGRRRPPSLRPSHSRRGPLSLIKPDTRTLRGPRKVL